MWPYMKVFRPGGVRVVLYEGISAWVVSCGLIWPVEAVIEETLSVGTAILCPGRAKSRFSMAVNYLWWCDWFCLNYSGSNHRIQKPRRPDLDLTCSFTHAKAQLPENFRLNV